MMGQSTDGLLWFGLCDDGGDNGEGLPESVTEHVGKLIGDASSMDDWEIADRAEELITPIGCVLIRHCSGVCQMYGIAIADTKVTAWRGHPKPLGTSVANLSTLEVRGKIKAACEAIGWPWSEPQWWLASDWS